MNFQSEGYIMVSILRLMFFFMIGIVHFIFCEDENNNEEKFTQIYEEGKWGRDNKGNGRSGNGSLPKSTLSYRNFLQKFMQKNNIKSVVDVGCGDWAFTKLINWDNIDYRGYDVVKFVIEKNINEFEKSNIHFFHCDLINTDFPYADLLICKDVLQHLSFKDILQFIPQLNHFKYCLITNDISDEVEFINQDILSGSYRCIDLTLPPFNIAGIKIFKFKSIKRQKEVLLIDNSYLYD